MAETLSVGVRFLKRHLAICKQGPSTFVAGGDAIDCGEVIATNGVLQLGYRSAFRASCDSRVMDVDLKLESLLTSARAALAAMSTPDQSVVGMVNRVAALRYAEGTLVGFLDALAITDPALARVIAPQIETFVSEAIAARILLD